jgi:hypothetical protein
MFRWAGMILFYTVLAGAQRGELGLDLLGFTYQLEPYWLAMMPPAPDTAAISCVPLGTMFTSRRGDCSRF